MSFKRTRRATAWVGICFIVGAAGCGSSAPKVEFAKVKGAVLVNGHPQRNVQVLFGPDPEKGNKLPALAGAVSDDQGNYALKYSYLNKTGEGAPVGWNRVSLQDMSAGAGKPSAIPSNYGAPATSPLTVEVKSGDNTINLEVKK